MKATGVVRKLDDLGRIVIPIELRRTMGIAIKDSLEIYSDGDRVILQKYAPGCVFCGEARDNELVRGKRVCHTCMRDIAAAAGNAKKAG